MLEIYAKINGKKIVRIVFSKIQAYATINQLREEGATEIACDFEKLDKLD